jgi:hypothetical protein
MFGGEPVDVASVIARKRTVLFENIAVLLGILSRWVGSDV